MLTGFGQRLRLHHVYKEIYTEKILINNNKINNILIKILFNKGKWLQSIYFSHI